MRSSERIVELAIRAITNMHARGPGDGRCNVQAKDERLHCATLEHTVCAYALFIPIEREELSSYLYKNSPLINLSSCLFEQKVHCYWADCG